MLISCVLLTKLETLGDLKSCATRSKTSNHQSRLNEVWSFKPSQNESKEVRFCIQKVYVKDKLMLQKVTKRDAFWKVKVKPSKLHKKLTQLLRLLKALVLHSKIFKVSFVKKH